MGSERGRLNISEYDSPEPIFIDANIFLDYALPNQKYLKAVSEFLERIELQQLSAVTTPAVLDEVSFIILMSVGERILKTRDRQIIIDRIKRDDSIAIKCYSAVEKLNELLDVWKGLQVLPVNLEDYKQASVFGMRFRLLSSDALHVSVMKNRQIENLATRDTDFDRVPGIRVWMP